MVAANLPQAEKSLATPLSTEKDKGYLRVLAESEMTRLEIQFKYIVRISGIKDRKF